MTRQTELPKPYLQIETDELIRRIADRKKQLGQDLCILGHHYQSDEVFQFADFAGDSLKLSQQAAQQERARYIVFCGVHFMAESADILSSDAHDVFLPNSQAGCTMADMADEVSVAEALRELRTMTDAKIVPITYVNSSAATKALTGREGGACCTSGNVQNVFRWALADANDGGAGGQKILAIPDQHLARNTAITMGYGLDDCTVYDPELPAGGLTSEQVARSTILLWKGHCHVHQRFTVEHVQAARDEHADVRVIVHPECPYEVVQAADAAGSTEQILQTVGKSPAGSRWAVGTESAMVNRLARQHNDRVIQPLASTAVCGQMKRIDLPHLLWTLDGLADNQPVNQIQVAKDIADQARQALQRMLDIKRTPEASETGRGNKK